MCANLFLIIVATYVFWSMFLKIGLLLSETSRLWVTLMLWHTQTQANLESFKNGKEVLNKREVLINHSCRISAYYSMGADMKHGRK